MSRLLDAILDTGKFTPIDVGSSLAIKTSHNNHASHWPHDPYLEISTKESTISFAYVADCSVIPHEYTKSFGDKEFTHATVILYFELTPENDRAMRSGERTLRAVMAESKMVVGIGLANCNAEGSPDLMVAFSGHIDNIPEGFKPRAGVCLLTEESPFEGPKEDFGFF